MDAQQGGPPILCAEGEGKAALTLRGVIGVHCAADLKRAALELAQADGEVFVGCAGVDRFDVTALQILAALGHELAGQGRRLHLVDVPEGLHSVLSLAGLGLRV